MIYYALIIKLYMYNIICNMYITNITLNLVIVKNDKIGIFNKIIKKILRR